MRIIAIDPGTSNTGLVYMDEHRIIDAETIKFKEPVKADQFRLMQRAHEIAVAVFDWMAPRRHDYAIIEGFVTYHGRQSGYTFQTPYLCGYLHASLAMEHFIIQTSRQVLNSHMKGNVAAYKTAMEQGLNVWGDCSKLTNDHVRSAACHGIYYYIHKED